MLRQYSGYVYSDNKPVAKGSCASWKAKKSRLRYPSREELVDTILTILDDHPQPMHARRPTKRVPTGAEQFNNDHQKPYDRYDRSYTNWAEIAKKHNCAFPAMCDELTKRQSTSKPIPRSNFTAAKRSRGRSSSQDSVRPCRPKRRRRIHTKRRCRRRDTSRRYRHAKVVKRRYDYRKRVCSDKTSQYLPDDIELAQRNAAEDVHGKDSQAVNSTGNAPRNSIINNLQDGSAARTEEVESEYQRNGRRRKKRKHDDDRSTDPDLKNPDSNKTSISAYDSYTSLDHEPMVQN